jgi:hypothetical protein
MKELDTGELGGDKGELGGNKGFTNIDWPLINNNLKQSIAYIQRYFEPVNGSWMQAICETENVNTGEIEYSIINGSWEYTFLNIIYQNSNFFIEGGHPEIINGDIWQSIWYYIEGEDQFEAIGLEGINYAINGSWMNNYYQLYCSLAGSIPNANPVRITSENPVRLIR